MREFRTGDYVTAKSHPSDAEADDQGNPRPPQDLEGVLTVYPVLVWGTKNYIVGGECADPDTLRLAESPWRKKQQKEGGP